MSIKIKIESLLFIATRPLSVNKITEAVNGKKDEVKIFLKELLEEYNQSKKGINIIKNGSNYQMVSNSENSDMIANFLKEEVTGELTPASLETLTVIAYRGPITKSELEMIRGVNCSVIIRNLSMRGFVDEIDDKKDLVQKYKISIDFMKHLGINEKKELPNFEKLNSNESLEKLLNPETVNNEEIKE